MQRHWRKLAAVTFAATLGFGTSACGDDVVDDEVEQDAENLGEEVEQEADPGNE